MSVQTQRQDDGFVSDSTALMPQAGGVMMAHRSISEIEELKKFREQVFERMGKPGKYGKALYGILPGTTTYFCYKPGKEFIQDAFYFREGDPVVEKTPLPDIVDEEGVVISGHREIVVKVPLLHEITGNLIGWGIASCSTMEDKYRYLKKNRECPECGQETIIKNKFGKGEFKDGWYCHVKEGGCGSVFVQDDERIASQVVGKIENRNPPNVYNTILSIAQKRAANAGTINHSRMNRYFTVMIDEDVQGDYENVDSNAYSTPPPQKNDAQNGTGNSQSGQSRTPGGAATSRQEANTNSSSEDVKKELWELLMEIHQNREADAKNHLVKLTTFYSKRDDKEVIGSDNLDAMKEIRAKIALNKLKDELGMTNGNTSGNGPQGNLFEK